MKLIELLAPARNLASACAAVDYGADALYIGGSGFGARRAAANSVEDIARVVEYAHPYGVKVYATFNTVIFDHELEEATRCARDIVAAGVDALIVQDMAVARMGLGVELHASTQMCNMTVEGVKFLEEVGFSRVVLERALSSEQIAQIASSTSVDIEAFVHGAICVSHSGRCLLSRSLSSRSGNRGECSQPCRLKFDLVDEAGRRIISQKHLLSLKDLDLTRRLGEMVDAGVSSFKIEGRLKEIGYTKNIVAHYRSVLDEVISHRDGYARSSCGVSTPDFTPSPAKSFTRGQSEYLFDGQAKNLASFETPKSMGERIGVVSKTRADGAFQIADSPESLAAGDGVCFVTDEGLCGTNINRVEGEWIIPNRAEGIARGREVFRNFDRLFASRVESSRTRRQIAVRAKIKVENDKITLSYEDCEGFSAETFTTEQLEVASNPDKMREVITTQLSKSGDTIFLVEGVEVISNDGEYFIPSSRLAAMRRDVLTALHNKRLEAAKSAGVPFIENPLAQYPQSVITAEGAVTNRLSEQFYLAHGVESLTPSWECADSLVGAKVMECSYCIRHEISECLKHNPQLKGGLYLLHGRYKYRLEFDCKRCRMSLWLDN